MTYPTPVPEERVVVNFADPELSDVCLVVGNTDLNVHKMTIACRSSFFKALFFRDFKETIACRSSFFKALFFSDFKEKNEKRITIEADPAPFQKMLEFLYDGFCANEDFFKCSYTFVDVFWKEGVPLWELLSFGLKYFEKKLNDYCCPQNTKFCEENNIISPHRASTCVNCGFRKVFAMDQGMNLKINNFLAGTVKSLLNECRQKNIPISLETVNELIGSMYAGVLYQ